MNIHFISVHLTGVHLTGLYLMSVHLVGMHLTGVKAEVEGGRHGSSVDDVGHRRHSQI
jgi:hypothetical protein